MKKCGKWIFYITIVICCNFLFINPTFSATDTTDSNATSPATSNVSSSNASNTANINNPNSPTTAETSNSNASDTANINNPTTLLGMSDVINFCGSPSTSNNLSRGAQLF